MTIISSIPTQDVIKADRILSPRGTKASRMFLRGFT